MAKNDYLHRQQQMKQGFLEVGMDAGFQKCWDILQIVLHDPKVMGKDIFGKNRIKKIYRAMVELESKLGRAYSPTIYKDADVCQRDLDALLKEIWGDELCPFQERYPYIKQPGYDKGRKEWKRWSSFVRW